MLITASSQDKKWGGGWYIKISSTTGHLGKSATIRESNHDLGVCKEHYA